jgi:hypothetical protein
MNEVPLKDPSGQIKAWICSICQKVHSSLDTDQTNISREFASRCCTCMGCGEPAGTGATICKKCEESQTKQWVEHFKSTSNVIAVSLEMASDKEAAESLVKLISSISEEHCCDGWLSEIEYELWACVRGKDVQVCFSNVTAEDVKKLRNLHLKSGGWWHWDDISGTKVFMTTNEWNKVYALHALRKYGY